MKNFLSLIGFISLSLLAGFIGSLATMPAIPIWYKSLNKPFFVPPAWLFAPVWTFLYLFMAFSAWLIFTRAKKYLHSLKLFFAQLVFNSLWSVLFFGFKSPSLAFLEIIVLWLLILTTIREFKKQVPLAGWLFLPYFVWVSFAVLLNLSIVILN